MAQRGLPDGIPESIDWKPNVSPVRKQGPCSCCWAITAAGACESARSIQNGLPPIILSAQELINCVKKNLKPNEQDEKGCYTSSISEAFRYIRSNGILREEECPFLGEKKPCLPKTEPSKAFKIKGYVKIADGNETDLLRRLAQHPVAAAIKTTRRLEKLTGEDIYEGPGEVDTKRLYSHAILITGYGTKDGKDYFEFRNSWGTEWGNNGYGKLLRKSSLPPGQESIIYRVSYPILFEEDKWL